MNIFENENVTVNCPEIERKLIWVMSSLKKNNNNNNKKIKALLN